MIEIDDKSGPDILKNGKYILMFYTDWCPRCPSVISALSSLEEKYMSRFTFAKINFDSNPDAIEFFGVSGVPAILSVEDGAVLKIQIGIGDVGICEKAVLELCGSEAG
jgi:thioredoxin 1